MKAKPIPNRDFLWRSQNGREWQVTEMTTTHLFFSIRLIVYHTRPKELHAPSLPTELLKPNGNLEEALRHMLAEIKTRTDLPVWMQREFLVMALKGTFA